MGSELPDRGEGETARNLRIADRPKVPRWTKQEQTRLMNCERPLYMDEWRETTRERQRGTLGNMKMAFYGEETTPEVSWGERGENNGEFKTTTTTTKSANRVLGRSKRGKRRRDRKRKGFRRNRPKRKRSQRKRWPCERCQRGRSPMKG